jgi:RNA polymerase sigma-70 factor (ECF subfamily)
MAPHAALPVLLPTPSIEAVFREHAAFVVRMVRRMGAPADEVEDAAQEVFLVLQTRPDLLLGGAPPRSVLFGVMRRVVASRRRARRATEPLDAEDHAQEPEQELELGRRRARALLDLALDELDAPRREVFVLYELEGLTMREVVDVVGVPLQTAYSRLHSARTTVRRVLLGKELP